MKQYSQRARGRLVNELWRFFSQRALRSIQQNDMDVRAAVVALSDATTSVNLIKEAKSCSAAGSAHIGAIFPLPVNVAGCVFLRQAYQLLSVKY